MPSYYCHSCEQGVSLRDGDFVCARCGGEFVEELPPDTPDVSSNPILSLFETMFNSGGGSSGGRSTASNTMNMEAGPSMQPFGGSMSSGATGGGIHPTTIRFGGSSHGATPDDNIIASFLNQLLANLSSQGAQIQLQITRDPTVATRVIHGSVGDYAWGEGGLDQIVTQLLNQFEGGATPIDQKLIANLPMISVSKAHIDGDTQCTTCMERFVLDEKVAELDCHHVFHRDCIVPWLQRHNTCPVCRQVIDATKWPSCNPLDELD